MCAAAIVQARLPRRLRAADPAARAIRYQMTDDSWLNHRCQVIGGVLADRCGRSRPTSSRASDGWERNDLFRLAATLACEQARDNAPASQPSRRG
jgi:hypothetical protein